MVVYIFDPVAVQRMGVGRAVAATHKLYEVSWLSCCLPTPVIVADGVEAHSAGIRDAFGHGFNSVGEAGEMSSSFRNEDGVCDSIKIRLLRSNAWRTNSLPARRDEKTTDNAEFENL